MKSRPTNQRISRQVDAYEQAKQRAYTQHLQEVAGPYVKVGKVRNLLDKVKGFFTKLFSPSLRSLDLRPDWARDPSRSDGAKQLRGLWPALGAMVSTRDGKKV